MYEIYKYKDNTHDVLDVDMLPVEQHGKDEIMFTVVHPVKGHTIQCLSVILPMDEVAKLINRLTVEIDVIARRSTPDPPRLFRPLD